MYVRPVKRICDVRGCKNKDCFSISRVRENGNTPVLCKSCLGMALSALDEPKVVKAQEKKPIPSLFFNSEAFPTTPSEEEKPKANEDGQTTDASASEDKEQKTTEDATNPPLEEGEGVKVVPNDEVENLVTPLKAIDEEHVEEEAPSEEEKPKAKKRAAKKGDK